MRCTQHGCDLGPLLFSLYVNSLENASPVLELHKIEKKTHLKNSCKLSRIPQNDVGIGKSSSNILRFTLVK